MDIHFQSLIENIQDIVTLMKPDGTIVYESPAIEQLLGYQPDELMGKNVFEFIHPDDALSVQETIQRALQKAGAREIVEHRFRQKDGSWRLLESRGTNLLEVPGIKGILVTSRDITEIRKTEEDLRLSEEHFKKTFDQSPIGKAMVSNDHRFLRVNPALCDMLGYTAEELTRRTFMDITHPDDVPPSLQTAQQLNRGERALVKIKKRYIRKDGELLWVMVTASRIRDSAGKTLYTLSMIENISDRKQLEKALLSEHKLLANVISNIPHYVFWKDRNSVYLGCNDIFARAAGIEKPEYIVGKTDYDLAWKKEESDFYRKCDREVIESGVPKMDIEESQRQVDGKSTTLLTSKVPLRDASGQVVGILGIYADITERKKAEQYRSRLASIVETSVDAIISVDLEMIIVSWNPAAQRLFGYSAEEAIGKSINILTPPGQQEEVRALQERLKRGEVVISDGLRRKKDGGLVEVSWILSPIRDSQRKIIGFSGIHRDITERRQLEAMVRHADKMSAMGQLTAGLAHEINNPLTGVIGFAQMLLGDKTLTPQQRDDVETIHAQGQRCRAIIQDLLQFSHRREQQLGPVDIASVLQQVVRLVAYEWKTSGLTLEPRWDKAPPRIDGDADQLAQVFLNLIENARDAMENSPQKTLEISTAVKDQALLVHFKDTGEGVDWELRDKIFEPFYTTKPVGKGTGLGLSICFGIIQRHKGRILVDSKVGAGTTMTVELPILEGS